MWREYFEGKTVVVSGGSMGIGAATVKGFASAGANVIVADVADDMGEALTYSLSEGGAAATYLHCDVSSEDDVANVCRFAEETYGAIDVVYANAGIEWTKDIRHTSLEEWRRVIDVNLTGVFLLARAAMQRMCDAAQGSIIVTSSPHAVATVPDAGAYAASKGGVHALVRALALEGAPFRVRVNGIVPGTIDTPMLRREVQAAKDPDHQMVLMAAANPMNRLGRPEEVANVALFLASPLAEFITGSLVSVDGGEMAALPSGPPLSYNN
ncbi:MAG TPA: SDR family NAD(P)-dependent oxidoreductase [Acidimicrobiia bacterium]